MMWNRSFSLAWPHPMSTEWVVLWCFCLFDTLLFAVCACGEFIHRIYPAHHHLHAQPKPLSQLITPSFPPSISDGDKASGSSSDPDLDTSARTTRRQQDGISASTFDAQCILDNVSPSTRLNKKVRKRQGARLVTLLSTDELYPSGPLVKSNESG